MLGVETIRSGRIARLDQLREGGDYLVEPGRLVFRLVSARGERAGEVLFGADHGHPCGGAASLDLPHDLAAVPVGQHQVDYRQVERALLVEEPHALGDRGRMREHRGVPEDGSEHARQGLPEESVILHDQDVRHCLRFPLSVALAKLAQPSLPDRDVFYENPLPSTRACERGHGEENARWRWGVPRHADVTCSTRNNNMMLLFRTLAATSLPDEGAAWSALKGHWHGRDRFPSVESPDGVDAEGEMRGG
jgi:hypothetical protein